MRETRSLEVMFQKNNWAETFNADDCEPHKPWSCPNINTVFKYRDPQYKYNTVVDPSQLYNRNSYAR